VFKKKPHKCANFGGLLNVKPAPSLIRPIPLPQLQIHSQRRRELSDMSKDGLVGRAEVGQHMLCWQNLLTAQSLELADLINSLDEEAAAEIRKVPLIFTTHTHRHRHTHPNTQTKDGNQQGPHLHNGKS